MAGATVLIIDDEETLVSSLLYGLKQRNFQPVGALTGGEGLKQARESAPDVVLLDLWLPDQSGMSVLKSLRESLPDVPVIIITAHGETQTAVETMKLGAADFILKPFELEELAKLIDRTVEFRRMEHEVRFHRRKNLNSGAKGIEAVSKTMTDLIEQVQVAARSQAKTILLLGESGTGKAMMARLIHDASGRHDQPFVEVNCAAIPANLFESQLFGHEKGAFTDAKESHVGLIRLAERGTLFLDEIGEMPIALQTKLLQFLESQRFRPVGGRREYTVDVRVVAATNRDLQLEMKAGHFRSDLFYRINVLPFVVPPLKVRMEDLTPLLTRFVQDSAMTEGCDPIRITAEAEAVLRSYDWPGNVRELKNLVERWTILHPGQSITIRDFPPELLRDGEEGVTGYQIGNGSIDDIMDRTERRIIADMLAESEGHRGHTAQKLGISRHALKRRMQRLGIEER